MNKELAEKLQYAGFPYKWEDVADFKISKYPTLSELIEECGDKFRGLEVGDWLAEDKASIWYAKSKSEIITEGSTPEEAVANLWLELNKK